LFFIIFLLRNQQLRMSKFEFEKSFGRTLGTAHTNLFKHLSKLMKAAELPITPEQFGLMTHLWKQDGLTQQELAVLTCRDRANVTRIIDILEREEIVERRDDINDRRVFKIFLTKKGKSLEDGTADCAKQAIKEATQGSTKEEIEICMKVLRRTIENLS
jgi:DNA-binding MarR family transcriptional regulator